MRFEDYLQERTFIYYEKNFLILIVPKMHNYEP